VAVVAVAVAITAGTGGMGFALVGGGALGSAATSSVALTIAGEATKVLAGSATVASVAFLAERGIGGHGWRGDKDWNSNVREVAKEGDHTSLNGGTPTQNEAEDLIKQAKGILDCVDPAHSATTSTHTYPHVHYYTQKGIKATIKIIENILK